MTPRSLRPALALALLALCLPALAAAQTHAPQPVEGFTPEQRFFLGFAEVWRRLYRPETLRLMVQTDPHSPNVWRVNGTVANLPEFAQAFGCHAGDPMVLDDSKRADIW